MVTIASSKKRKNIDLPVDTLQKLSRVAASQNKSLKAYIESILVAKAETINVDASMNPSPSNDLYFEDDANLQEIEKRVNTYKSGEGETTVTLQTAEEINEFINKL